MRSRTDELMSHYCRHVYDLKLPPQDSPEYIGLKPCDDEVESFQVSLGCSTRPGAYHLCPHARIPLISVPSPQLLPVQSVITILQTDPHAFKPNCGLAIVDFLMRHGLITAEDEPDFWELGWRCRRDLSGVVAFPVRRMKGE